jgi:ATP-dependent RNA helicase RhlE
VAEGGASRGGPWPEEARAAVPAVGGTSTGGGVGGGGPRPEEARAAVATGGATGRSGVQAASRVAIGGWSSVGRDGARQPQAVEGGRSGAGRGGGRRAPGDAGCRKAAACGGSLGLTGHGRGRVGRLDAGVGKN